ncbi:MAG: DUF3006 domain-containing protein [Clostridium sp.]|uniref:DUF3006 domain-containing protein n=1 Tax=Clostridium sp. TaxID=1506 RepID=UPI002A84601B|nr:DUF3006 domain-containing protein [Clostridium sp.]MDY5097217.1 DUF3006 domain-containing protein [Clostridium sp.]
MGRLYVVDRIEGNFALCEDEDGAMKAVSLEKIKGKLKEGVVLLEVSEESFIVDEKKTKEREEEVQDFMKGMWSDEE